MKFRWWNVKGNIILDFYLSTSVKWLKLFDVEDEWSWGWRIEFTTRMNIYAENCCMGEMGYKT